MLHARMITLLIYIFYLSPLIHILIPFRSITLKPLEIFQRYLMDLWNRLILSVACKNDNLAYLHFCPPTKVEGTIVMGPSVRPYVCTSVRRHNLISATPPTVFKGY